MQLYTIVYFCKLRYKFRVVPPPIIRSTKLYLQQLIHVKPLPLPAANVVELGLPSSGAQNYIYSNWYMSNCYCYLPLPWWSWDFLIRSTKLYPQQLIHVKTLLLPAAIVRELGRGPNSSTIAGGSSNSLTYTSRCRYSFVLLMMGGGTTRNIWSSLQK